MGNTFPMTTGKQQKGYEIFGKVMQPQLRISSTTPFYSKTTPRVLIKMFQFQCSTGNYVLFGMPPCNTCIQLLSPPSQSNGSDTNVKVLSMCIHVVPVIMLNLICFLHHQQQQKQKQQRNNVIIWSYIWFKKFLMCVISIFKIYSYNGFIVY